MLGCQINLAFAARLWCVIPLHGAAGCPAGWGGWSPLFLPQFPCSCMGSTLAGNCCILMGMWGQDRGQDSPSPSWPQGCESHRNCHRPPATQLRNEPRQLRWHRELYGGWEPAAAPSTNTAPACILGAVGRIRPLTQGEQGWQRDGATHCHSLQTGQSAGGPGWGLSCCGNGACGQGVLDLDRLGTMGLSPGWAAHT